MLVDAEPDTFCIDVARIEEMITPRTKALLVPNLIGNAPDWDAIAAIADRHGLVTVEDSCDTLGPRLRGTPTGTRSTFTVTSFANSHILTCGGNGGMLLLDDDALRDRALMLRRWGRRSEVQFFGTKRGEHNFWEDLDGIRYDNQFIFDELGWNFEPSEMGAAFGLEQLKKLDANLARRRTHVRPLHRVLRGPPRPVHAPPPDRPSSRPRGSATRSSSRPTPASRGPTSSSTSTPTASTPAPSGPATSPASRCWRAGPWCSPPTGSPTPTGSWSSGVLLPLSHAIDDATLDFVLDTLAAFLSG